MATKLSCVYVLIALFLFIFVGVVGEQTKAIVERGVNFLVPLGKLLTQKEEKNDVRIDHVCITFVFVKTASTAGLGP